MSYNPEGGPASGNPGQDPFGQPGAWGAPGGDVTQGQAAAPGFPAPYPAQGPGPAPVPQAGYGPPQPGYGPPQPGYGPPGYPAPGYGMPMAARKTNGMAVTGMVLGIISLVLFWAWFLGPVLAVLGIIFSAVGISQCGKTNQDGKGMAIAGLVCSLISAALWVLLVIAVESFVNSL